MLYTEIEIAKEIQELLAQEKFGIKLGLANITAILEKFNNPQNDYFIIHIAGTNGKGSTSKMLETSLNENNIKVGRYSSPYIEEINEMFSINENDITDEKLVYYYKKVKEKMHRYNIQLTLYEITTTIMFLYAKDSKVQYLVLEVGLGGRFDATNVVQAQISAITNISLDHTQILGDNLEKIAFEKLGIIKGKEKVFIADKTKELINNLKKQQIKYTNVLEEKYSYELDYDTFQTKVYINKEEFIINLFGYHQVNNFLLAYSILKEIGISDKIIKKAMLKIKFEGRMEKYSQNPLVFLDGAHNEGAVIELSKIMEKYPRENTVILLSILEDKNILKIVKNLRKISNVFILTSLQEETRGLTGKSLKKEILKDSQNKHLDLIVSEDTAEAYQQMLNLNKKINIVCGSFKLINKVKKEVNI